MALLPVGELKMYRKLKGITINRQLRKLKGTRVFNNVSANFRRALARDHRPKWHRAKFRVHQMKVFKPMQQFAYPGSGWMSFSFSPMAMTLGYRRGPDVKYMKFNLDINMLASPSYYSKQLPLHVFNSNGAKNFTISWCKEFILN